ERRGLRGVHEDLRAPRIWHVDTGLARHPLHAVRPQVDLSHAIEDDLVAVRAEDVALFDLHLPRKEQSARVSGLWVRHRTDQRAAHYARSVQQTVVPTHSIAEVVLLEGQIVRRDQLAWIIARELRDSAIAAGRRRATAIRFHVHRSSPS